MRQSELDILCQAAVPLIEMAIGEDIGPGDATSQATLPADLIVHGRIVAKETGVIEGLPAAEAVFRHVNPAIVFASHVSDGQEVVPGELVAENFKV